MFQLISSQVAKTSSGLVKSHKKLTPDNLAAIRFRIDLTKLENKILDNG
ncbi:MAG: hypothetical protein ACYTXA_19565 [Nostoc sp.]